MQHKVKDLKLPGNIREAHVQSVFLVTCRMGMDFCMRMSAQKVLWMMIRAEMRLMLQDDGAWLPLIE